jgi:hypothetical protein
MNTPLQTDNVAWSIYSTDVNAVNGNDNCGTLTYADLTGAVGTAWAVINLNVKSNIADQPLLGIFPNSNACSLIYSLPSGIIGGYIYIYTNYDDGNHPEVVSRIKLIPFPCTPAAPLTTEVSSVLFGTMRVTVGNFVLLYAGYNTRLNGCSASQVFGFPTTSKNGALGNSLPLTVPGLVNSKGQPDLVKGLAGNNPIVGMNGGMNGGTDGGIQAQFPGQFYGPDQIIPGLLPGQVMPGLLPGQVMPGLLPGQIPGFVNGVRNPLLGPGRNPGIIPGLLPGQLPGQFYGQFPGQFNPKGFPKGGKGEQWSFLSVLLNQLMR